MNIKTVPLSNVKITGGFWELRQRIMRDISIAATYYQLKVTGRINAFKLDWQPGMPNPPHVFWDSDTAKWVETACYSLITKPDHQLREQVDELVASIVSAQQPDGYLNTHFTVVEPDNRFTNLRDLHELYCAGHLMEAAVAHFQATGSSGFLDAMSRYAGLIDATFGPADEGKKPGYCGHPEIELALVKLAKVTGNEKYLNLAKFFINERGNVPYYYEIEAEQRGEPPKPPLQVFKDREYRQSHVPIRDMEDIVGHAVRAQYLMAGATDIALETGDAELARACHVLWDDATVKKMYITGGMGARPEGEAFDDAYELPNDTAYAETCAAIAMFLWGHRMMLLDTDARYADAMERALYNGILSGISLSGDKFFYVNPLTANLVNKSLERTTWFGCSCCPNNLTRLVLSLGQYVYTTTDDALQVHFYVEGEANTAIKEVPVTIKQTTAYPWDENVAITLTMLSEAEFTIQARIPGWCRSYSIWVNDTALDTTQLPVEMGYVALTGAWHDGDVINLKFDMPVERVHAHPAVAADRGRVALQRGPIIFCLEQVDNGQNLESIVLPASSDLDASFEPSFLGGVVVLQGNAVKQDIDGWKGKLYSTHASDAKTIALKAIPYFTWGNRNPREEMIVWIRESP